MRYILLISFALTMSCMTVKQEKFSYKALQKELQLLGVKHPKIVLAQAKLETGNFKSNYFKKRNNLFGFRNSKGYLHFKSWQDCCKYYKRWQRKRYKGGNYYHFLKQVGYAVDPLYIKKLKKCLK